MSSETQKTVVRRLYTEANDQLRYDLLPELVADDLVYHGPLPLPSPGREGLQQLLEFFRAAFPEQRTAIHQITAEGDLVTALHTHHVVHGGTFMGLPPTGKELAVAGIEVFRVADGKIVEMWQQDDLFSLLAQLGMIALPA
jgi:steroid delta-isomerase-like uncharacterized protein